MQEFDIAGIGRTGHHRGSRMSPTLSICGRSRDADLVGHAEAWVSLCFHIRSRRRIDRLNRKPRRLDIFLLDAGRLQRGEDRGHRFRIGVACFFCGLGARGDAARDPRMIRRRTDAALADYDNARLRRRLCVVGAGGKRRSKHNGKDNGECGSAQKHAPLSLPLCLLRRFPPAPTTQSRRRRRALS